MSRANQTQIYKIFTPQQWSAFQKDGVFNGAPIDVSDGYIHLSSRVQVEETARKHFSSHETIIIGLCDSALMDVDVKWEPSRGGDLFPHLYGALPLTCVTAHARVHREGEKFHILKEFPQKI